MHPIKLRPAIRRNTKNYFLYLTESEKQALQKLLPWHANNNSIYCCNVLHLFLHIKEILVLFIDKTLIVHKMHFWQSLAVAKLQSTPLVTTIKKILDIDLCF